MAFENTEMDLAAAEAEGQLDDIPEEQIAPIANWIRDNYLKAGYKRLCKVLLQHADKPTEQSKE